MPEPEKEPGYAYRWIRTATLGHSDALNVSSRRREGWEPVKLADHPELNLVSDKADIVEVGGLMLCKNSQELVDDRNAYYSELSEKQVESVDNSYLRENDPRMPMLKPSRKSTTTFGSRE